MKGSVTNHVLYMHSAHCSLCMDGYESAFWWLQK